MTRRSIRCDVDCGSSTVGNDDDVNDAYDDDVNDDNDNVIASADDL